MLRGSLQVYCGGSIQVYSAVYLQVNHVVLIQVYYAKSLLNTVYSVGCVESIAIYGLIMSVGNRLLFLQPVSLTLRGAGVATTRRPQESWQWLNFRLSD